MTVKILLMVSGLAAIVGPPMAAQGQGGGRGAQDPGREVRPPIDTSQFSPTKVVDRFEPIVDAPFIKARDVKDEVRPEELVLGIELNGQARAYPINQLTGPQREIINDQLGGRAIAATW